MLVSDIIPITKDRHRVVLDTGESFVLYKGELRTLKIAKGSDISDEMYDNIMHGILPKRAKLRMMNLLKTKDYTEYQLSKKLLDAGYPDDVVREALTYVKSFDYVDDLRFAKAYINDEASKRSRKEIWLKLSQKGIEKEVLDRAFADIFGSSSDAYDVSSFDEEEVIKKALIKKHFTGREDYEERQKLLAYFYRRGFEMDKVYRAMDHFSKEE